MQPKRICVITFVVLLAVQLLAMPLAFADEVDYSLVKNSDGSYTATQTYTAGGEVPEFPETITHNGKEYTLKNTTTTIDPDYVAPSRSFSRTLFSEVSLSGINNLGACFPASIVVNEGDYQGEIGLDPSNPYTVVNRYEAFRAQVDRTTSFYNLPDNDVTRIPTYQEFQVSSAAYPGATTTATLQILDVSYAIAGADHLGLPNNYTAHVTYRGQEEYLELHHYDVTANYAGELTSSAQSMAVIGTYSPTPIAAAPVDDAEVPLAAPVTSAESEFPLVPLAITGAVVVVFLATPLLFLFFLSNARLIRVATESEEGEEQKETTELICRRRLVLKEGVAEFRIPSHVDIFDGDTYYLAIKPRLADREGEVSMTWQGKTVAVVPLERHTDINFRDMLVASVETILMETDILD